ncbi:hypothetical protein [Brevibacillus dissolubilis]|uniref:hypothetical protein n=1 Tax=Brevibacillus dissolubilis TaxID=1844116 RepID=UPI00111635EB|nr:hypothetical protein [Brevibacillus dissolubilis]
MAQRLATNYSNAFFTMTEQELNDFVKLFAAENFQVQVKVCDNGDRDIVIEDKNGEIELSFRRSGARYSCESSYVIKDLVLANVMRKAMKTFKGHGIVHRIYEGFTMVYHYDEGSVTKIEELTGEGEEGTDIFEASNTNYARELDQLFQQTGSEQEIHHLREQTDRLLDLRNWAKQQLPVKITSIDEKLTVISHRLFVLEAY